MDSLRWTDAQEIQRLKDELASARECLRMTATEGERRLMDENAGLRRRIEESDAKLGEVCLQVHLLQRRLDAAAPPREQEEAQAEIADLRPRRIVLQELGPDHVARTFSDGTQDRVPYGPGGSVDLDPNGESLGDEGDRDESYCPECGNPDSRCLCDDAQHHPATPECDKIDGRRAELDAIRGFLEWIEGQGYVLAQWFADADARGGDSLAPMIPGRESLLFRYIGVDPVKRAAELDALLEYQRSLNANP